MLSRSLSLLSFFVLALPGQAQDTAAGNGGLQTAGGDRTAVRCDECPTARRKTLGAGDKMTDSAGASADLGTGANGAISVTYTGTATESPRGSGCWSTTGEITDVDNPRSGGTSNGPINVDTNGQSININLNRTGSSSQSQVVTNVTGGNANVTIGGNSGSSTQNNTVNVGGTGNSVTFGGRSSNNTGNGGTGAGSSAGQGSGGTVNMGGSNNNFNSRGGNWQTRS